MGPVEATNAIAFFIVAVAVTRPIGLGSRIRVKENAGSHVRFAIQLRRHDRPVRVAVGCSCRPTTKLTRRRRVASADRLRVDRRSVLSGLLGGGLIEATDENIV